MANTSELPIATSEATCACGCNGACGCGETVQQRSEASVTTPETTGAAAS